MDITILVAMLTPIALLFILTPIFYIMKLKREYHKRKNLTYLPLEDAILSIDEIINKGYSGKSYVIFSLKDADYYLQYGYESNGFILYFFKSPIFQTIHYSKFKNVLVNHNFKQVTNKSIEMLVTKEFLELNGGFNVNIGTDINEIHQLTKEILEKVFETEKLEVSTELEL